jgi:hypothetical protein
MNKGCALHALKSLASPARHPTHSDRTKIFILAPDSLSGSRFDFLLSGLKVRSVPRFAPGTVLIFFSLLRRFFLDIDVA